MRLKRLIWLHIFFGTSRCNPPRSKIFIIYIKTQGIHDKNDKNEIKTQVIYLYVCYPPGLEDYSSRPGIVSRSLSRGGFLSLSGGRLEIGLVCAF